jgi:preprotein translocase subunit SecA
MLGEIRFFDEGVGPDLSQQFIFFEQVSSILNQDNQGVERLRGQAHLRFVAKQSPLRGMQAKRAELVNRFCLHGHMAFTKALEKLYASLKTSKRFCG